jgi:two-component system chemotaxis sensor kinase CheA
MSGYELIFIDDELEMIELYENIVKDEDFLVKGFSDSTQAREYLLGHNKNVAMIVSDYLMPDLNGMELREEILSKGIDLPFIIVTGHYNQEMSLEAMRLKISHFVKKPIEPQELIRIIKEQSASRIEAMEDEFEMVKGFLEESSPMIDEIEDLILELENDPANEKTINTYFIILHTIKGTASCLGLIEMSKFAHAYEDLINLIKRKEIVACGGVIDALLKGLDVLKKMYFFEMERCEYDFELAPLLEIFKPENIKEERDKDKQGKEEIVDAESKKSGFDKKQDKEEKIPIPLSLIEGFLEESGELSVLKTSIFKMYEKLRRDVSDWDQMDILGSYLSEMHKISSNLQNMMADMKKTSLSQIYRPLKRVVREAAKECNKQVEFITIGENLKVDLGLGKMLSNILVHMLRNSIDHGIEDPERRKHGGKHETGTIQLESYFSGDFLIVEIRDDGGGIDRCRIEEKIIEKKILTQEELAKLSDRKVFNYIFDSGFSTAEKVTNISGRGVGMDMVKSSLEEYKGKIHIESKIGAGTTFFMSIPIPKSVQILDALHFKSSGCHFSIGVEFIEEVYLGTDPRTIEKIQVIGNKKFFQYREKLLPLVQLSDILSMNHDEYNIGYYIQVNNSGHRYLLAVDEINDIAETVVKKMSPLSGVDDYFLGASLVGDTKLGYVLNLEGIAHRLNYQVIAEDDEIQFKGQSHNGTVRTPLLRFTINGSSHNCLLLESVHRLEVFDKQDITFHGDYPIARYWGNTLPLISLCEWENDNNIPTIVVSADGKMYGLIVEDINDIVYAEGEIEDELILNSKLLGTIKYDQKTFSVLNLEQIIDQAKNRESLEINHVS